MARSISILAAQSELEHAELSLAYWSALAAVMTDAELRADYVTRGSLEDAAQEYQFRSQGLECVAIGASQLRIARAIRAELDSPKHAMIVRAIRAELANQS